MVAVAIRAAIVRLTNRQFERGKAEGPSLGMRRTGQLILMILQKGILASFPTCNIATSR